MKLLSVIIPLYNSSRWLPKCLDSILNQDISEESLEVICINDGSPDDSERIALQYQAEHPSSIVVLNQENQGPSGARNNGMRHATGKYLCFVDPDDYVEPNVFGALLRQMESERLDVLRFNYQIVDEEYRPVSKRDFELRFDYSPCLMTGAEFLANRLDFSCNIWRYFYRTELITTNQIWCFTGDYYDDTPWLPMVLMKANRMGVCGTVVYDYQERSDSLVNAKNLDSDKRKNEGCILLIQLLQEELQGIKGEKVSHPNMEVLYSISLDTTLQNKIVSWYEMMIARASISLLTRAAVFERESGNQYLKELREMNVFPLSEYKAVGKLQRKIRLFNKYPRATMKLLQLRNNNL